MTNYYMLDLAPNARKCEAIKYGDYLTFEFLKRFTCYILVKELLDSNFLRIENLLVLIIQD